MKKIIIMGKLSQPTVHQEKLDDDIQFLVATCSNLARQAFAVICMLTLSVNNYAVFDFPNTCEEYLKCSSWM